MISKKEAKEQRDKNRRDLLTKEVQERIDRQLVMGQTRIHIGGKDLAHAVKEAYETEELGWRVELDKKTEKHDRYGVSETIWYAVFS